MKIIDLIYGEFEIDGILEELINTKAVQRLKGIHQGGASYLINPKWNVTRYEHSVGVMLFIRIMGGSIEEQIAGLLHDISHTAFSHVVDFALDNDDQDYHEKIYAEIIKMSGIPEILESKGYDYKDILFNEKKWTILEQSAPKLCADRIDYTLRDRYQYGNATKDEINSFLSSLKIIDGEVAIDNINVSEWFIEKYYEEVIGFFYDPLNSFAYDRLSKAMKEAFKTRELTLDDFIKQDDEVYKILISSKSDKVKKLMSSIKEDVKLEENERDYDIRSKQKLRIIDPTIYIDGKTYKTSEKSKTAVNLTERAMAKSNKGIYIRIIN